jgi:hypothetical protein
MIFVLGGVMYFGWLIRSVAIDSQTWLVRYSRVLKYLN